MVEAGEISLSDWGYPRYGVGKCISALSTVLCAVSRIDYIHISRVLCRDICNYNLQTAYCICRILDIISRRGILTRVQSRVEYTIVTSVITYTYRL